MSTESVKETLANAREEFSELVKEIRPQLHRYCARMTGSVIDSEDIVQDSLAKALYAMPMTDITNLKGWLFRITHNQALDFLRKNNRESMESLDNAPLIVETASELDDHEVTKIALNVFLRLAPLQRSCVILKDVLGHSLTEISEQLNSSIPAIKAALYRGRTRLREISNSLTSIESLPDGPESGLLTRYVDRFNAHDFDALRNMLAEDVRLDLVGYKKGRGANEVGRYFHRYSQFTNWRFASSTIDSRPCILAFDTQTASQQPAFFILIEWRGDKIRMIRDYHHSKHVIVDAQLGGRSTLSL